MYGPGITVINDAAAMRHQDFLREAKRVHLIDNAFGHQPRTNQHRVHNLRTTFATILLRAGMWMMPEATSRNSAPRGLELRLGR